MISRFDDVAVSFGGGMCEYNRKPDLNDIEHYPVEADEETTIELDAAVRRHPSGRQTPETRPGDRQRQVEDDTPTGPVGNVLPLRGLEVQTDDATL